MQRVWHQPRRTGYPRTGIHPTLTMCIFRLTFSTLKRWGGSAERARSSSESPCTCCWLGICMVMHQPTKTYQSASTCLSQ
eukprot:scaffold14909_cov48-Prasinocladus_malaysianus.AAC.1